MHYNQIQATHGLSRKPEQEEGSKCEPKQLRPLTEIFGPLGLWACSPVMAVSCGFAFLSPRRKEMPSHGEDSMIDPRHYTSLSEP